MPTTEMLRRKASEGVRRTKAYQPVSFKAAGESYDGSTLAEGEFVATAAVIGNIDSYGERMGADAFTETLAAWAAKGDPIPVIYQHSWGDPWLHIGYVAAIGVEDSKLVYKGVLDIADNPVAAQVYRLMKGRRLTQQSFGFDIIDAGWVTVDSEDVYEITKCDLFEVGPCLVGVNRATELLDIKSGETGATPIVEPDASSGQVHEPAADVPSEEPASAPEKTSASKALSPASVMLNLEIMELENEEN
jgi:HK97 family phage prohead protease